ncbi:uncharacterized protein LOC103365032 [Stegastes partitus]|uniref:Uncharacterized protein LOC103365032 n=1 Tax=Stegastes partitus TaxID=144197 RepID=A0A9Y4KC30_9TELE|nr:PREDICTED: uncharacterized protein LOC103365032 [Stegastes partitus]
MVLKHRAGLLTVACAWMAILMQGLDARHAGPQKRAAAAAASPCRPKELAALARSLVEETLTSFDEANGKHLGAWSPGFPELQVHQNAPVVGSEVQCGLIFMAKGLEEVLKDQKDNLNPGDTALHKKLHDTISRVKLLATCLKNVLGGECPSKPSPPAMPEHAFERKQFGHTLLKTAKHYLDWLQRKLVVHVFKMKEANKVKPKVIKVTPQRYLEGSRYQL